MHDQRVITLLPEPSEWYAGWEQWRGVDGNQFFLVDGRLAIRPYGQPWRTFDDETQTYLSETVEGLFCDDGRMVHVLTDAVETCLGQANA